MSFATALALTAVSGCLYGLSFPTASIQLLAWVALVPLLLALRHGITICNEAMFPEVAAARAREGAVFFVDPANDTWLTPEFSAQQFDIVRLRTVEQRRYLVRASTAGPSAIVDPFGRVVVRTAFETRAAIAGTIWPLSGVTPYGRMGDAFALGCGLVALAAWVARSRATVAAARPATDAQPALDRPPVAAIGAVRPSGSSGPMVSATDWRET